MSQILKPKKGYKKVKGLFGKEIEIPEEWELKSTSEIMKITMGQSPPSESYNQEEKGLPFYQGVTDFGIIFPNPTIWCTDSRKIAEENSILFSVRAPVGEINLTKKTCCLGRGVAALNPLENELLYCYYLVNQNKKNFLVYSQGTTYDAINQDEIANTKLLYTKNINEQQKIALILSNIDNLINSTQKIINQTKSLKQGLMQKLLTRGIGHKKFKKVKWQFGKEVEIPEEWKIKSINELGHVVRGASPRPAGEPKYFGGDIPWITVGELTKDNHMYLESVSFTLTNEGRKQSRFLTSGTFVIANSGATLGVPKILKISGCANDGIAVILELKEIIIEFLYHRIFSWIDLLRNVNQGIGQPNLNTDLIGKLKIPLPSIQEQQKIASILSNIDSQIQSQIQYKEKLKRLKKSLMQKLLTGKVMVKV